MSKYGWWSESEGGGWLYADESGGFYDTSSPCSIYYEELPADAVELGPRVSVEQVAQALRTAAERALAEKPEEDGYHYLDRAELATEIAEYLDGLAP